jgi:hypothetical protein
VLTGCRKRFSSVDVEDVDEADLSPAHVALAARPDNKQVDTVDVFELEAEQAFDNAFSVFCYFEDLHRLQKRLVQSWKECKAGKVSLVPTAAPTQAAIQTVRRVKTDLRSTMFPDKPVDNCYQSLAGSLVMMDLITKGADPVNDHGVDISPFDNFIFLTVARTLRKFAKFAAMTNPVQIQWPTPIMPLTFNYISQPHKGGRTSAQETRARRSSADTIPS